MAKEKIYDFGILGKWSETTLKENICLFVSERYSSQEEGVQIIEDNFNEKDNKIDRDIELFGDEKIKKIRTILELYNLIKIIEGLKKEKEELRNDYIKYLDWKKENIK